MVTLYRNLRSVTIGGYNCTVRVRTDGVRLYFTVGVAAGETILATPSITVAVTYGGQTEQITEASEETTVSFDYTGEKTLTVSGTTLYINNVSCSSHTFSWSGDYESMLGMEPQVSYSFDCIKVNVQSTMTFTVSGGEGLFVNPVALSCTYTSIAKNVGTGSFGFVGADGVFTATNPMTSYLLEPNARVQYRIEVACYASEEAMNSDYGENFIGYADVLTPDYIVSSAYASSAPFGLTYGTPISGAGLKVSWKAHGDIASFTLSRSANSGNYTDVYSGSMLSYTDVIDPSWSTVVYRVCSSGSPWLVGEKLAVRNSNLFIGTPDGIAAAQAIYVGEGGTMSQLPPLMSVGGM